MLSLYIHIPFCVSKCHYCDFNSFGLGKALPGEDLYLEGLQRERDRWSRILSPEIREGAKTLYFGGGTPSLFSPPMIEKILQEMTALLPIPAEIEKTLEMNPKTASLNKIKEFRQAGINRLSIGIQTLDPTSLKALGRAHDAEDALETVEWALEAGFERINVDLMVGLPAQTLKILQDTLAQLEKFPLQHVSAYELILEEGTPFYEGYRKGNLSLPSTEEVLEMRDGLESFVSKKGMQPYEISNYAKPGHESQHNCAYWDYESFIGLGAGAVSFLRINEISEEALKQMGLKRSSSLFGVRLTNPYSLKDYLEGASLLSSVEVEFIDRETAKGEFMMMGLRKRKGIQFSHFQKKFEEPFPERFYSIIVKAVDRGWMEADAGGCCFTNEGILLSNEVMREFLPLASSIV